MRMKKYRDREQCFVLEGEKMVLEVLRERPQDILCICAEKDPPPFDGDVFLTDAGTMKELSSLTTPNKYLAVVRMPTFEETMDHFVLALDGIQDPGNMGTILRTAEWFGVNRVVCSNETVDIYNQKVIQASMGSVLRMPVTYVDLPHYLSNSPLPVYGALLEGKSMHEYALHHKGILVMGNEGSGITPETIACIENRIFIPGFGKAESLNVAVATGILLAAFARS